MKSENSSPSPGLSSPKAASLIGPAIPKINAFYRLVGSFVIYFLLRKFTEFPIFQTELNLTPIIPAEAVYQYLGRMFKRFFDFVEPEATFHVA